MLALSFIPGARKSDTHPTAALKVGAAADGFPQMATAVLSAIDMRPMCAPILSQIGSQCVGQSVRSANAPMVKNIGTPVSPRGVYVAARVREIGRKGDAIPDTGCQPSDAYDAIVNGVALYPQDARDFDPSVINARDTWDEEVLCKALPVNALAPLDDGDTGSLDLWLSASCTATFTIDVDDNYFALSPSNPVWTPGGQSHGLHRQATVGRIIRNGIPVYIVENSWGPGWADGGYSYIPVAVYQGQASETVVHRAGVTFP